jgi:hypothetical protein
MEVRFLLGFQAVAVTGNYTLSSKSAGSSLCLPILGELLSLFAHFKDSTDATRHVRVNGFSPADLEQAVKAELEIMAARGLTGWTLANEQDPPGSWPVNSCWNNTNQKWEKCSSGSAPNGVAFRLLHNSAEPWYGQLAGEFPNTVYAYLVLIAQPLRN